MIEANDRSGVMSEYLFAGNQKVSVTGNFIQFNNGFGVESYGAKEFKVGQNSYAANGKMESQERVTADKKIMME